MISETVIDDDLQHATHTLMSICSAVKENHVDIVSTLFSVVRVDETVDRCILVLSSCLANKTKR